MVTIKFSEVAVQLTPKLSGLRGGILGITLNGYLIVWTVLLFLEIIKIIWVWISVFADLAFFNSIQQVIDEGRDKIFDGLFEPRKPVVKGVWDVDEGG